MGHFICNPIIPYFHGPKMLPFNGLLAIPTAVALSQWTEVLGWESPRSLRLSQNLISFSQFKNNTPDSASAAEATTKHRIKQRV